MPCFLELGQIRFEKAFAVSDNSKLKVQASLMQPHALFEPMLAFDLTQVGATKARCLAHKLAGSMRSMARADIFGPKPPYKIIQEVAA